MANWNNPQLTTSYTDFLTIIKDRDVDLALQFDGTGTNVPTNAIRWDSTANRWKKWNGSTWVELTSTYALTGLSTTSNATITGDLTVNGTTVIGSGTATTPATNDSSTKIATTAYVRNQNYMPQSGGSFSGNVFGITAASGTSSTLLATTAFVATDVNNRALLKSGGAATGSISLLAGGFTYPSPSTPADLSYAAIINKSYLENYLPIKTSVIVASTTNLAAAASGTQYLRASANGALSIDSVSPSVGDSILVAGQTNAVDNGVYYVSNAGSVSTPWVLERRSDGDTVNKLAASIVPVRLGTANADKIFLCTTNFGGAIGSTSIFWRPIHDAYIANLIDNSTVGLVVKNGTTSSSRSIAVAGSGLTVSNATGAAGDPTITIASASANTASTVVFRDANGAFTAGNITIKTPNGLRLEASGTTNYMGIKAPTTVTTNVDLTLPNGAGNDRQSLITDGTGVLSWAYAGGDFVYYLNADVVHGNATGGLNVFGTSGAAISLPANTRYEFEAMISLSASTASNHTLSINPGMNVVSNGGLVQIIGSTSASAFPSVTAPTVMTVAPVQTEISVKASNTLDNFTGLIKGTIGTDGAGLFSLKFTCNVGTVLYTTEAGSYLKLRPIGAGNTNISIGSWS